MSVLNTLMDYFLHVDQHLLNILAEYGTWIYALMFIIIFCETGLVILPFLPGDSLLFALGSLSAHDRQVLNIEALLILLITASYLGNYVNYKIGAFIGPSVFAKKYPLLNPKYLHQAHAYYNEHGGKTIIIARFMPIIRTFAPFIAGVCKMNLRRFHAYNFISALLWITSILLLGYYLGGQAIVQAHFTAVIYLIIFASFIPTGIGFICQRKKKYG